MMNLVVKMATFFQRSRFLDTVTDERLTRHIVYALELTWAYV